MKTKKLPTAISLALIFAMGTAAYAGTGTPVVKSVTYVVNIDKNLKVDGLTYIISVLDEMNRAVAHPQIFQNGVYQYTFTETGSAKGNLRVATMVSLPTPDGTVPLVFDPVKLAGPFKPGAIYNFPLLIPRVIGNTDPFGVK